MGSLASFCPDIFEIYCRFCDIVSRDDHASVKEELLVFSKSLGPKWWKNGDTVFNDIVKLMAADDLTVDSRKFSCFYDFVYFICRENGQKSITVTKAITAWRLVLAGRFRLLDQWCDFVEKNQRHNISEDTWKQLLAFSWSVKEDLEGYDPKEAWPVLIDEFVEHMHRINQSNNCSTMDSGYTSCDMEIETSLSNTFPGLNLLPGSKRRFHAGEDGGNKESPDYSVRRTVPSTKKDADRWTDLCLQNFSKRPKYDLLLPLYLDIKPNLVESVIKGPAART